MVIVDIQSGAYLLPYPVDATSLVCLQEYCDLLIIERNDLQGIAHLLRAGRPLGSAVLSALANKLNPPMAYKEATFEWRRSRGRPSHLMIDDQVELALVNGDLAFIAKQLREPGRLDPRVLPWLADQCEPASENHSHLRIQKPRKERARDIELKLELLRVGKEIREQVHRGGTPIKSALYDAVHNAERNGRALSHSKARRAYDFHLREKPFDYVEFDFSGVFQENE